jgi:hypothetical protein
MIVAIVRHFWFEAESRFSVIQSTDLGTRKAVMSLLSKAAVREAVGNDGFVEGFRAPAGVRKSYKYDPR